MVSRETIIAASMRPPVLPSGNDAEARRKGPSRVRASMRPPVLPSGNRVDALTRFRSLLPLQ